ncbi:uncharacterized protein LOC121640354 isoform X1 [Melanotaenia boesemani]|uniref:uncharacterized protein LOC121640354 isoform X1 n=1 Tax=Melanotaenia boesemani TaxID=1250792 RepID=UPI001C04B33D|nr:uncharacterized protein LOC121640354 isoform X1 [Melanotaenia boesemani]
MGKIYQVEVYGLRGERMMIDLCNTEEQMKQMTVLQLKEKVAQRLPEGTGIETLRLIFTNKMLNENSALLSTYGIQHLSVIHMVVKVPKVYQVLVYGLRGERMMIDLCNTEEQMKQMTVLQLKEKVAQRLPEGTGIETLRLIFTNKMLNENSALLSTYGIQHLSVIHMVVKVPKVYQVLVYGLRGERMMIDLCNTEEQMKQMTVLQLKEKVAQRLPEGTGIETLRLIFTDKMLNENSALLSTYGIQHLSVIHMVFKVPKVYQVEVYGLRGERMMIDLCNTEEQMKQMTVLQLKEKVAQRLPEGTGIETLRLIFTDKMLNENSALLSTYGIQHLSVIHMVFKVPKVYQVEVYGLRGERMMIDLCNTEEQMKQMTVLQLKEKVAQRLPEGTGIETLRLIFTDKMLNENSVLLSTYGIQHLSVIHMVFKVPKVYQVEVYGLRGERMMIDLCNTEEQMKQMTVLQLKEKVAQRLPEGTGIETLRLIFTDKMLNENSVLLSTYGIQHLSVIHMVFKVPKVYQVEVYGLRGERMMIDLCNTEEQMKQMTVLQLKEKVAQRLPEGTGIETLRLIFTNKMLNENSALLSTYGIQHLSVIHMVVKVPKVYQVLVYGLRGERMMIDLCNTEEQMKQMTVLQLKEKVAQRLPEGTGIETLRLIFTDKMLNENSALLSTYGIQHLSVIHMVFKVPKVYQVEVYGLRGERMMIDLCNTEEQMKQMTVLQLKEKVAQRLPEGTGIETLRLIFTNKMLNENSALLSTYGIQHLSVIHMVVKVPKVYQVLVYGLRGERMMIDLCNTEEQMKQMTVLQLKEKVAQRLPEGTGIETLRLIFTDKMLNENSALLSTYGIQHLSVIHMVFKVPKVYQVEVYGLRGERMMIDLCNTEEQMKQMTVLQLKEKVAQRLPEGTGIETLRLIFTNKMLNENSALLSTYGIQHLSVIHMVVKVPKVYQVEVYGLRGERMMIDLCNTEEQMKQMTVLQLKEKVAQRLPEGTGIETLRLIFTDKMLNENSALLSTYGIQHLSVIHMVVKVPKVYQVEVYGLRGENMMIDLCNTEEQMKQMTVLQLKEKVAQRLPEGTGIETLRLIFTDKMLDENSALLATYGIQHLSVIHMVVKVPGGLTA